jgi:hypothetical protein
MAKLKYVMTKSFNDKCLGLPAMMGIDRADCFNYLIDIIKMLISGWKENMLSVGGKEALIKAVVHAIPYQFLG